MPQPAEKPQTTITAARSDLPPRSGYVEVEFVEDVDGIMGIISRRVSGPPIHSIGIFKMFERDGIKDKTIFWAVRQAAAVQRVLSIIVPRAQELEAAAMIEFGKREQKSHR